MPDAWIIHPTFKYSDPVLSSKEYLLRTKHYSKSSTKSNPCSNYHPKTCMDVLLKTKIANDYHCQIPILYSGKHLDGLNISNLVPCNISIISKALSMSLDKDSVCSRSMPCEHTDYFIDGDFSSDKWYDLTGNNAKRSFSLIYNLPFTEHYQSFRTVTEQTLIGNVGGILGITLGWAAINAVGLIDRMLTNIAYIIPSL